MVTWQAYYIPLFTAAVQLGQNDAGLCSAAIDGVGARPVEVAHVPAAPDAKARAAASARLEGACAVVILSAIDAIVVHTVGVPVTSLRYDDPVVPSAHRTLTRCLLVL